MIRCNKYTEAFRYIVWGVNTVIVNTLIFMGMCFIGLDDLGANTIAFVVAVQFAYYTNTKYVFKVSFTRENFIKFWAMRIGTIVIDNLGLLIFINYGANRLVSKMAVNIIIIILNYIISKVFIFRSKGGR